MTNHQIKDQDQEVKKIQLDKILKSALNIAAENVNIHKLEKNHVFVLFLLVKEEHKLVIADVKRVVVKVAQSKIIFIEEKIHNIDQQKLIKDSKKIQMKDSIQKMAAAVGV